MSLSRKLATLIATEKVTFSSVFDLLDKYKMTLLLPSIKDELLKVSSQKGKLGVIMIEAPFEISDDAIKKVKRVVGNDLAPHEVTLNKKLLAGFKARYNGMLYDGSADRIIKQLLQ